MSVSHSRRCHQKISRRPDQTLQVRRPSYDDDGYVIRFWKGVLPSNILNVLHGLTEEVKESGVFGALRLEIVTFDETAERLPVRKIIGWSRRRSSLLDPFEELSSKVLFTRRDLNVFLRQWEGLQSRLLEVRLHLSREGEAARGWLDEMVRVHASIQLGSRIQEWQKAYSRLRHSLPAKCRLLHAKFDALSNRALYSREPLQHFWNNTIEQLKGMRISQIDPGKLTTNLIKDFFLTAYFAFTFCAGSRAE